ncbi:MAG: succinate dehydrogenase, hydrophobic membrane anchor protein [Proteobacteria bacterium]|nr:succinate dehydrogenase, hydrophobic membrane anchor protein [Pseudomonadota bacterium]
MLGARGSRDWLIQRFTAIFLAFYTLFLFAYVFKTPTIHYEAWVGLFSSPWMQLSTLFALISVALHAWVGLWTVSTDYIKPIFLRYLVLAIIFMALFIFVVWGIFILWGN